ELLTNINKTCPSVNNTDGKIVAVTPKKTKELDSLSLRKPSTSANGSQPSGNTKKDKIRQTPSGTQKNKVETHPRKVKSSLKNKDCVVQPKGTAHVQHSKLNANSKLKCVKCNGCMLSDNHDLCVLDFINNVNAHKKSESVKKKKVWKPTGKVFTNIGYIWRPIGRTFNIVRNVCPLTRITTTAEVPLRKPTALENEIPKPVVTLVYSRKPRKSQTNIPVSKSKVQSNSEMITWQRYWDMMVIRLGMLRSYVEGLGHNLFSVRQFCYSNLEVAFYQHTFIQDLEGVDLLTGSRDNNLYTLSLGDMMASSPICLFSKASKTKRIIETIHVDFDELTAMASEHGSSGPALHEMTPTTISSGLMPNPSPSTSFVPPSRTDWDILFQPMFDDLLTPSPNVDYPATEVVAPIHKVVAPVPIVSTGLPSSTNVNQDAPSPSHSQTTPETQPLIIPNDVDEDNHDIQIASILWKCTRDHPLENIIGELARPVSTRLQLHERALFCYYDSFLTVVEPKTYKDALTQSCWIEAMQEELNELERLEV
ncbi:hypothetical protein Tco_1282975, partial [Tanacetum coccineum]